MAQLNLTISDDLMRTVRDEAAKNGLPTATYARLIFLQGLDATASKERFERLEKFSAEIIRLQILYDQIGRLGAPLDDAKAVAVEGVKAAYKRLFPDGEAETIVQRIGQPLPAIEPAK